MTIQILRRACGAPQNDGKVMFREHCRITENIKVAPGHFAITLGSKKISEHAKPGQFVQVICSETGDPLLPRPFSFLTAGKGRSSFLYQVVGRGTDILSKRKAGESLWILGPLGNGFSLPSVSFPRKRESRILSGSPIKAFGDDNSADILLVGGGVGIPPLYHLAETLICHSEESVGRRRISKPRSFVAVKETAPQDDDIRSKIHVFLGARNKSLLLCEKDFKKLGVHLHLATNDDSRGHKGFITELLEEYLSSSNVLVEDHPNRSDDSRQNIAGMTCLFTCGPTPMLKAVSGIAQKYKVPCEVSVEVPMACGFGACLGCAITVKEGSAHRFAIACCEGPVFKGSDILWE